MASRSARARAMRTAVAVAAVAAPLAAAGSAQAAIAGAAPASTTSYPDLISATATSATTIQACYDKALNGTVANGQFVVSNYLSGDTLAPYSQGIKPYNAAVDGTNNKCVNLSFAPLAGNQQDLGQGTIVSDIGGATSTDGTSATKSLADSVTLASSTTQTGTIGHTAGPDLTSVKNVTPAPVANVAQPVQLAYTFDQNVDPNSNNVTAADYGYEDASGNKFVGTGNPTVSGSTVTVTFAAAGTPTVAYVTPMAAYSANDGVSGDEVTNQPGSFNVNGASAVPTLAAASLNAAAPSPAGAETAGNGFANGAQPYSTVTYVFDHPAYTSAPGVGTAATGYKVALSDGADLTDGIIQSTNPSLTVVTVAYPDLSPVAEYAVEAVVAGGQAAPGAGANGVAAGATSTPSSYGIGGNAGALARGYTTGPDVQKVVAEGTNANGASQFLVYLDQRVDQTKTVASNIKLLNAAGKVIGTGDQASLQYPTANGSAAPGQQLVLVTFTNAGSFFTPASGAPTQIAFTNTPNTAGAGNPSNATAAFSTFLGSNAAPAANGSGTAGSQGADTNAISVPQIVSLTAPAAHAKAIKHHAAKRHVAKKHTR